MTEQQALAALAQIEGLIDHPDRAKLERSLFKARNGGWNTEYKFWHMSETRQRVAILEAGNDDRGVSRTDIAIDGRTAWSLGQTGLIVIDPKNPPPQTNLGQVATDFYRSQIEYLAVAGLNPHLQNAKIVECSTNPNGSWSGRLAWNDGENEILVSGSMATDQQLRIEEVRVATDSRSTKSPRPWTRLSSFREGAPWDRPIAWVVERVDEDGKVVGRSELVSMEPLDAAEATELFAVPEDGSLDPLRGVVSLLSISDLRPGGSGPMFKHGDTFKRVEGLPNHVPPSRSRGLLAGIIAGVVVLGTVTWAFVYRKKQ